MTLSKVFRLHRPDVSSLMDIQNCPVSTGINEGHVTIFLGRIPLTPISLFSTTLRATFKCYGPLKLALGVTC